MVLGVMMTASDAISRAPANHSPWTQEEDDFLKANYGEGIKEIICMHLGRSWQTIQTRASKVLKIKRTRR